MTFKKFFTLVAILALTLVSVAALALHGTVSIDGSGSAVKIAVSGGTSK
jgi:hypothetical protein